MRGTCNGQYSLSLDKNISYDLKYSKSGYREQTIANNMLANNSLTIPDVILSRPIVAGGDGTPENPYQISTPSQLRNMVLHFESHFILTDDIDLSRTALASASISPILWLALLINALLSK